MNLELFALRGLMAAGALAAAFFYGVHVSNERNELKRLQAESAAEMERLSGAVLARAFRGEL